jgi:hypothetical protein
MIQTNSRALLTVGRAVGVLFAAEAATFLLAALTHLEVGIPLGFGVLREPRIIDATVVEGLCALLLATAAYAVLTHRAWAWLAATVAHSFAIAGVLLGILALAAAWARRPPPTPFTTERSCWCWWLAWPCSRPRP